MHQFVRLLLRVFGRLPLPLAQAAGAGVGGLAWILRTRLRRNSLDHLTRCFPDREADWRRRTARASVLHTGRALADCAHAWTRPPATMLARIRGIHGEELLTAARERGKGIIVAAPHIGAWEVAGIFLASRVPLTVLYRPPRLQALDPLLRTSRRQAGVRTAAIDAGGIRTLHRALGRGEAIGVLPDQAPRAGHGVIAPYFGESALTMTLLPRLARRSGATVLYVIMARLPHGRGYEMHILPADPAVADDDDTVAATAMNRDLERCISLFPEQYNWSYRRFRRRSGRRKGRRD